MAREETAKERAEPPEPAPVIVGDLRIEALLWGKARDLGQNGGLIEAFDRRTGESLWVLKVYEIDYGADMEGDKLDTFIEEMTAEPDGSVTVRDEKGRRYRVDPESRTVRAQLA